MDVVYQEGALLNKKVSTLESSGSFVDCSFVLHEKGHILDEKLFGVKRDIRLASPVLATLIDESEHLMKSKTLPAVIIITNTKFSTFKILLQYIHCSVLPEELNIEQIRDLSVAAKRYEVAPLKDVCASLLEAVVDVTNIWPTLDHIFKEGFVGPAAGCKKLLVQETLKCINHPSFLRSTKRAVLYLLIQEKLNFASEGILLDICQKWAQQKGRNYLNCMKQFVPHLRLLTLDPETIVSLHSVLGPEELGTILSHIYSNGKSAHLPKPLCPIVPRQLSPPIEKKFVIIPDDCIWGPEDHCSGSFFSRKDASGLDKVVFTYDLGSKRSFFLTGIEILHQIHPVPTLEFNSVIGRFEEKPLDEYYEENLEIDILGSKVQKFEQRVRYNSSTYIKLNETNFIDSNGYMTVGIRHLNKELCFYRKINANDLNKRISNIEHELIGGCISLRCRRTDVDYSTLNDYEDMMNFDLESCYHLKSFTYVLCQD